MKRRNFIGYLGLFLASCSATRNSSSSTNNQTFEKPPQLNFAVTDVQGIQTLELEYEELRAALARTLATEIVFFPVESYTAATVALGNNQVDLVLTGPSEYVIIRSRTNAVPVVALTRPNYHSVIAVMTESGIRSLTDLQNQTIAMTAVGSTSGHIGPTSLLVSAGLDPKSDIQIQMLGDRGLPALKQGEVKAWGGGLNDYESFLETEGLTSEQISILIKSPALPNDVLVASSKLDPDFVAFIKEQIVANQATLLPTLAKVENGKYARAQLVPANDADYNIIREVYKAIGQGNFFPG